MTGLCHLRCASARLPRPDHSDKIEESTISLTDLVAPMRCSDRLERPKSTPEIP